MPGGTKHVIVSFLGVTVMKSYVSFKNIVKSYDGDKLVVKNLNLEVQEGEFLTMLGPSGSGKTTSLMMLAGLKRRPRAKFYCAISHYIICRHINEI